MRTKLWIGEAIKKGLGKKQMTASELAMFFDVSPPLVHGWCNNKRDPSSWHLIQICLLLDITQDIFGVAVQDELSEVKKELAETKKELRKANESNTILCYKMDSLYREYKEFVYAEDIKKAILKLKKDGFPSLSKFLLLDKQEKEAKK